ncbi:MAG: hypothetical protein Q8P41_22965 [Pseudomonadota bacterium]|nr:hypothetical protein [Pseudomonadota bacterium]
MLLLLAAACAAAPCDLDAAPTFTLLDWRVNEPGVDLAWSLPCPAAEVRLAREDARTGALTDLGWQGRGATTHIDVPPARAQQVRYVVTGVRADADARDLRIVATLPEPSFISSAVGLAASWEGPRLVLRWSIYPNPSGASPFVERRAPGTDYEDLSGYLPPGTQTWSGEVSGHGWYRVRVRTRDGRVAGPYEVGSIEVFDPRLPPDPPAWDPGDRCSRDPRRQEGWDADWTSVTLRWLSHPNLDQDPKNDVTVRVQRSVDGVRWVDVADGIPRSDEWFDTTADPRGPTWYRLVARDAAGRESAPGAPRMILGQDVPPCAPEVVAEWDPELPEVRVTWTATTVRVRVERVHPHPDGTWTPVTGWLPPGTTTWRDRQPPRREAIAWRVVPEVRRVEDPEGIDVAVLSGARLDPEDTWWTAAHWAGDGARVTLGWVVLDDNPPVTWRVERSDDAGTTWVPLPGVPDCTDLGCMTEDTPPRATAHAYRYSARRPGDPTVLSRVVTVPPLGTPAATPVPPSPGWDENRCVSVSWQVDQPGVESRLERQDADGRWAPVVSFDRTEWSDTALRDCNNALDRPTTYRLVSRDAAGRLGPPGAPFPVAPAPVR